METIPQMHIAVFPWLAFGHMIPYLELSESIALKGHKISFISTPRNIQRLPKLPPRINRSISFVEIPFPKEVQSLLPQGSEATTDITTGEEMSLLKKAADALEPLIASFLGSSSPDWVICDFFPYWLPDITKRLKIRCAHLTICNARILAFSGPADGLINGTDYRKTVEDFMVAPKWVDFETKVAFRRFEAKWFQGGRDDKNASGVSDFYRIGKVFQGCDAILVRGCHEFDSEWLTVAEEIFHKPVIPVGLMPPQLLDDDSNTIDEWLDIKKWLDNHSKESVVYVALGSEVVLTQDQLTELAIGLELSNVPFFWVQRNLITPSSSSSSPPDSIQLPEGFEERVRGRGIMWKSWAPQLKILSHGSVGAYLTHCGWGSVVEALTFGRVLIGLPFWVDKGLNARAISEKQLGVEIPRNDEDGSFVRSDVAETVKLAMAVDGERVKIREEAKRASLMFGDKKLHQGYLNSLVEFLQTFK